MPSQTVYTNATAIVGMQSRFNERSIEYQGLQRYYVGLDFEVEIERNKLGNSISIGKFLFLDPLTPSLCFTHLENHTSNRKTRVPFHTATGSS